MRILDEKNDSSITNTVLMLTLAEARELRDGLDQLIGSDLAQNLHIHIPDNEYEHEITVAIYSDRNIYGFNERIKSLIQHDR
jgi:hypothetical protein